MSSELILVVDDDDDVREMIELSLTLEGYDVLGLRDGLEALEWVQTNERPACILLDLRMPRMNGAELVSALRREPECSAIPVVFLSGDPACREIARDMNVAGCLVKPVDLDRLIETVSRWTANNRPGPGQARDCAISPPNAE